MWSKIRSSFTSARSLQEASSLLDRATQWTREAAANATQQKALRVVSRQAGQAAVERSKVAAQKAREAALRASKRTSQAAKQYYASSSKQTSLQKLEYSKQSSSLKSIDSAKQSFLRRIQSAIPSFRWFWWWSLAAVGVLGLAFSIPREVRLAIENRAKRRHDDNDEHP
mmetsp:Transcript_11828/g.21521  ORF Transcript_11828/g.21521 Transcript_11828/m.21521 type:complete len:169 (-) Transcript_11828:139-645(-)